MPANINFTSFTDEDTFLASREDANIFFGTITVPNATTTTYGVIKKATSVAAIEPTLGSAITLTVYRVETVVDGVTLYQELCDKTEVENALNSLRTKLNSLITALQTAGIIQ